MNIDERISQCKADIAKLQEELTKLQTTHKIKIGDILKFKYQTPQLVVRDWEDKDRLITVNDIGNWCNGRIESLQSYLDRGVCIFVKNVFED